MRLTQQGPLVQTRSLVSREEIDRAIAILDQEAAEVLQADS